MGSPSASLTSRSAPARYAQEGSCPSYARRRLRLLFGRQAVDDHPGGIPGAVEAVPDGETGRERLCGLDCAENRQALPLGNGRERLLDAVAIINRERDNVHLTPPRMDRLGIERSNSNVHPGTSVY